MFSLFAILQEAPSLHPAGLSAKKQGVKTQQPRRQKGQRGASSAPKCGDAELRRSSLGKDSTGAAPRNACSTAKASWVFKDSNGS